MPKPEFNPIIPSNFKFKTCRLEIRLYEAADYTKWKQGFFGRSDPKYSFDYGPVNLKKLTKQKFLQKLRFQKKAAAQDKLYNFGIFHRKTGQCLGWVDIFVLARLSIQNANIGYAIHNQHQGNGYATEAVKGAIKIAFNHLRLHRLEAGIEKGNRPSYRVARACGMKREATRKNFVFEHGKWIDLICYTIASNKPPIVRIKLEENI